jgi:CheY-like chemotaxis protein
MPTILVVDDDPSVCRATARTLRLAGYATVTATRGEDAWKLLEHSGETIDAVVSDVVMPGLTGTQLAALVRARRPTIPVVLVSAYSFDEVRARGVQVPSIPLLVKPYDPAHLISLLGQLLDESQSEAG